MLFYLREIKLRNKKHIGIVISFEGLSRICKLAVPSLSFTPHSVSKNGG